MHRTIIEAAVDSARFKEMRGEAGVRESGVREPGVRGEGPGPSAPHRAAPLTNRLPLPLHPLTLRGLDELAPLHRQSNHMDALKANVWARYSEAAMRTVLFLGATPGDGASTAAAHFASALAQDAAKRVLLIDANLVAEGEARDAGIERPPRPSLAQLLDGGVGPVMPVAGESSVYVLAGGMDGVRRLSLLESGGFDRFLSDLRERFDHIVLDAPALQGHPESLVLARRVDGVILVVAAERTRKRTAAWAKEQIEAAGGRVLGAVLNRRRFCIPDWLYQHV